jgi:hypothetical protein
MKMGLEISLNVNIIPLTPVNGIPDPPKLLLEVFRSDFPKLEPLRIECDSFHAAMALRIRVMVPRAHVFVSTQ